MIRFESRSGSAEGRMAFDTGAVHNTGPRPDELDPEDNEASQASTGGFVLYDLTTDDDWTVTFHEPR